LVGVFACWGPVVAESSIPEERLRGVLDMMAFQMSGAPGMMVGIVSGGDEAVIAFGETAKGSGVRPSLDMVWPIGSVSKVFTGQILASMVVSGEVRLTDPLSKYLPEGAVVPEAGRREILLVDLATHTAGLPRGIIDEDEPGRPGYLGNKTYTMKEALAWLKGNPLEHPPGSWFQYSNFGFGLLGQALARTRGVSFGELVEQFYAPLGMKNTTTKPSAEQMERKASSYWMNGEEIDPDWPFDFEQPSGGIYCDGHDVMTFLRLSLGLLEAEERAANLTAHATYVYEDRLENAQTFSDSGMALGWSVLEPRNGLPTVLHKNGWVSGFNTWVMIVPSEQIGVFSFTNKPFLPMEEALQNVIRMVMQAREPGAAGDGE